MKPYQLHFGSLYSLIEYAIPVVMRNKRKPCLPAIGGRGILLDSRPGVDVNTCCLQQFVRQFVVVFEALTF
jgi:hypothetical protein